MRVNGELYLLVNGLMDFLCLALTAALAKRRLRPGRIALASMLGAAFGLFAWSAGPWVRSAPALALIALLMAWMVFGKAGFRLWPMIVASGWFYAGASAYLLSVGCAPSAVMLLCGAFTIALILAQRFASCRGGAEYVLRLTLGGQSVILPAFRDTGNLLRDACTGLPVIVAPEAALRPLLPPGVRCSDLSTLPPGWHLVRAQTAAGEKSLMCFRPDELNLRDGRKTRRIRAAVALSDSVGGRALLPDEFFMQEEGVFHANHGRAKMDADALAEKNGE